METIRNTNDLKLYRERVIPKECLLLKDDKIIYCDENVLITTWKTINPKLEFDHGASLYDFNRGIKISKFYRPDNTLLYYYCDIVSYDYRADENALTVKDLLADVIIYPDGQVRVVDLDELADALTDGFITPEELTASLKQANALLNVIYSGQFDTLVSKLEKPEKPE